MLKTRCHSADSIPGHRYDAGNKLAVSGLYESLCNQGLLDDVSVGAGGLFQTLPYEWCFSQVCDAAALVLEVQAQAMDRGLSLIDVTPFNIRFVHNRPTWTDARGFEPDDGRPWDAYEAFCRQYLATLYLMRRRDPLSNRIFKERPQAWTLLEASRMMGARTFFHIDSLLHIHMHARAQRDLPHGFFLRSGEGWNRHTKWDLIDSLKKAVFSLRNKGPIVDSGFATSSRDSASDRFRHEVVRQVVGLWTPRTAVVVGDDCGIHARVLAAEGVTTAVLQTDPRQAEHIYRRVRNSATPVVTSDPFEVLTRWNTKADLLVTLDLARSFGDRPIEAVLSLLHRSTRLLLIECGPEISGCVVGTERTNEFEKVLPRLSPYFTPVKLVGIPTTRGQLALLRSNS